MSAVAGRPVTVVVNGTPYTVEVGDLMAWPLTVTVNGVSYQVEMEPAARSSPTDDPSDCDDDPDADGASDASRGGAEPGEAAPVQVRAPMPGTITAVHAGPGDSVAAGQALCTLEAMKMRNAVRASRAGIIAAVAVATGQTVACGDVLFTLA
jgi:biotin carboxyl carrier protein